jgi:hypothetical protein
LHHKIRVTIKRVQEMHFLKCDAAALLPTQPSKTRKRKDSLAVKLLFPSLLIVSLSNLFTL